MNQQQCHIFFCGTVQGVGFRWQTRELALLHGICGWVRNLPDGRVELLAQGARLAEFLEALRGCFAGCIRHEQVEMEEPSPGLDLTGFAIRH